jgi:hypothetical protein
MLSALSRQTHPDSHDWKSDWRLWLPLAALAWALAWFVRDPFITDWDSFDYAACVVEGTPSPLGLGRALFLGYNRALWLAAHHWFGLKAEDAYLVIRYGVIAQSGVAIIGLYALYRELTARRDATLLAVLMVSLSPLFIVYSGRGMSEIPGIVAWSWSLWWMLRSLRARCVAQYLIAAALFGLGANMREFAVLYLPLIPLAGWLSGLRWKTSLTALMIALITTLAGPIFWLWSWPEYYLPALRVWYGLSAQERLEHPVTMRNLWLLIGYAFVCSPAATLITPATLRHAFAKKIGSDQRARLLLLLACCGLVSVIAQAANHDLALNPRYLLIGLPSLAPWCGWRLAHWRSKRILIALVALTLVSLVGMQIFLERYQWPMTYATRDYSVKISALPDRAVFIVGKRTPLVNFYRRIGAHPDWQTIAFGSGWPDDKLGAVIDAHLKEGRPVFVDFDEKIWTEGMRTHSREAAGLEMIRRTYKMETVRDSLCRLIERK